MVQVCCLETTVTNHQPVLVKITEEQRPQGSQWWESEMLQVIDLIYVKSLLSIRMIVPVYYMCLHLFFSVSTHAIKSCGIHMWLDN